ncbi:hypothetical protein HYR69_04535 [Candidatus Sumerlaeota bacterium]|nr:hypothetical protein [Candidatus Sumerlaeota bacterium]
MAALLADRRSRLPLVILAALAVAYIVLYAIIALTRMNYPFELEWMEGGTWVILRRLMAGKDIYAEPSIDFIPPFYTPLYYYVSLCAAYLTGAGFIPLRLVSFISSLGCFIIIFQYTRRITGAAFYGVLSAGLYAATFAASGGWFDLGRIDSLFLLLTLLAIYTCRFYGSPAGAVGTVILNSMTHGWYFYYTTRLMTNQAYNFAFIYRFLFLDMLPRVPVAMALSVFYYLSRSHAPQVKQKDSEAGHDGSFILFVGIGMIGASWLTRVNIGGYKNVLMPAYAFFAIYFGIGFAEWLRKIQSGINGKSRRHEIFAYAACAAQFVLLAYNPFRFVPSEKDLAAGRQFIAALKDTKGDVLLTNHPYLLEMAGKRSFAHTAGTDDVMRGDNARFRKTLRPQLAGMIERREFAAIILEREWIFKRDTQKHYRKERGVFSDPNVFWPVTGWHTRPEEWMIPKEEGEGEGKERE